jgi:hypothetical protein
MSRPSPDSSKEQEFQLGFPHCRTIHPWCLKELACRWRNLVGPSPKVPNGVSASKTWPSCRSDSEPMPSSGDIYQTGLGESEVLTHLRNASKEGNDARPETSGRIAAHLPLISPKWGPRPHCSHHRPPQHLIIMVEASLFILNPRGREQPLLPAAPPFFHLQHGWRFVVSPLWYASISTNLSFSQKNIATLLHRTTRLRPVKELLVFSWNTFICFNSCAQSWWCIRDRGHLSHSAWSGGLDPAAIR